MKYASASEHRDFFQKNHYIEFENLLTPEQVETLNAAIRKNFDFKKMNSEQVYLSGHDLWRLQPETKKIVTQKKFAEIASELFTFKPIRLGYDQLIVPFNPFSSSKNSSYAALIQGPHTLSEISSIDGMIGGVILRLDSKESVAQAPFPSKAGNGIYFDLQCPIDFSSLKNDLEQVYLLIAYVQANSFYVMNEKDPNVNSLKKYGYIFGSKLALKHHPILFE